MSDMDQPQKPDAKHRLQASREALIHQLMPATRPSAAAREIARREAGPEPVRSSRVIDVAPAQSPDEEDRDASTGFLSVAKHSIRSWWEYHPARAAGAIAQPLIEEYAQRRPFKLLGIAAGVGATFVVVKPWRLVSVGGLAVAALKSSHVSKFALTMLMSRGKKNR